MFIWQGIRTPCGLRSIWDFQIIFFLRISLGSRVNSDGANNALQAWDMLHGHVLLHGWLIGDATFYFFELPLNAITGLLFGMGNFAAHVASALTYLEAYPKLSLKKYSPTAAR